MATVWLGVCERQARLEVVRAVRTVDPLAEVTFLDNGGELRAAFLDEEPGTVGAVVGPLSEGNGSSTVSDINLAAALVHDGLASRVVLVGRNVSGSTKSRAHQAGVRDVVDLALVSARSKQEEQGAQEKVQTNARFGAEDLAARLPQLSKKRTLEEGRAPIFVVASGRGGVGKTSVAAALATTAGAWDMKVALVDLDLGCGNLYALFGLPRPATFDAELLGGAGTRTLGEADLESFMRRGAHAAPGVTLWGPCAQPEMAERVSPIVAPLLTQLSAKYDLVVVDSSTTCTDAVAQALQACDRLLLVHDELLGGITALARTSALAVRLGVARTRIVRVANHGDRRSRFELNVGRAEIGLETARAYRVLEGGATAMEALTEGQVVDLIDTGNDFTISVGQMLASSLDELGRLPEGDRPRQAIGRHDMRQSRLHLFGRKAV